jgi:UDP-N-acetylglucosamine 2-epimerase (non-hydrolysing)
MSPWPEEGYRTMMSIVSSYHFAPTKQSAANLISTGINADNIFVTGNTVIDALLAAANFIDMEPTAINIPTSIRQSKNTKKVLVTGHRRENFGEGLHALCAALLRLAARYSDIDFIFPVHLNPTVQSQVKGFFKGTTADNIILIEPRPYLEFVWLMKECLLIITDSGGIQEEAPSLHKPVLVTRDTTERPEGVLAGTTKLVGTGEESLFDAVCCLLDSKEEYEKMANGENPYGKGQASVMIADIILKLL